MLEDPTGRPSVAVGPSREAAAQAFGQLVDDLVVTTYDDLAAEIDDLAHIQALGIADGDGARGLLERALSAPTTPQLLVEVPGDAARRGWLVDVLAAHPDVGVVGTETTPSGATTLVLGPAGPEAVSGPSLAVLVGAVPVPAEADSSWPDPMPVVVAGASSPDAVPARIRRAVAPPPPDPTPLLARIRGRLGRRQRAALVVVGAAAVVSVLVLALIGQSDLGADGVLVALLLAVGALQALTVAALAYVVRDLRRSGQKTVEFRNRMMVRTRRLMNQGVADRKRAAVHGKRLIALHKATGTAQKHHHEYVVELGRQLNRNIRVARTDGERLHLIGHRQTQALLNLHELVRLQAAVPPAGGWAASPDLILFCVDTVLAEEPALVVECGSGLSTLFMSLTAEQHGLATRIVALEHDEHFAESTRALLERHGVQDRVEVRLAPLEPTTLEDHDTPWYAESALQGLDGIGVLLVDGPPTGTGPQARYPAVPLLHDSLAPRCTIVMDDLIRESDHETAESWAALLPDFDYSVVREFEKHVGILRRR